MRLLWYLLLLALCVAPCASQAGKPAARFDPGTIDYPVHFNDIRISWKVFAVYVMPNQTSEIRVDTGHGHPARVTASAGALGHPTPTTWQWHAPSSPGPQKLIIQAQSGETVTLHALVMVPAERVSDGHLNGYRIGSYPKVPLRGNPIYLPPSGFIEVTAEMLDLPLSPHFTLGQFLCKQQPEHWPKYLVLREALIAKLEIILEEVNRRGIRTDSFVIMSGYRTPWYNRSIGNVPYSRHVWGGAADIYIDNSGDGRMDDLNGDGRVSTRDARVLLTVINDLYDAGIFKRLIGGLGLYGPRPHRGPFVHVDARGNPARWEVP